MRSRYQKRRVRSKILAKITREIPESRTEYRYHRDIGGDPDGICGGLYMDGCVGLRFREPSDGSGERAFDGETELEMDSSDNLSHCYRVRLRLKF